MKLKLIFLIAILTNWLLGTTLYEDGDSASDWTISDNRPSGATISSVIDNGDNVIEFDGHGKRNAYLLGDKRASNKSWNNSNDKNITWSMKFNEPFRISVYVKTTKGSRVLYYDNKSNKGKRRRKIHHGLGSQSSNGEWQNITRDLESDLQEFESNNELEIVYGFEVRGSGMVDDIYLLSKANQEDSTCDESTAITREELITMIGNGEDVTQVNTCKITDMSHLFDPTIYSDEQNETVSNFNQDISGWNTSSVTTMASMFSGKVIDEWNWRTHHPLFNQNLNNWDVSKVTDMSNMFAGCEAFNQPLADWNVSNVTTMWNMFGESGFNQPIGDWNVSNVTEMNEMFSATPFNQDINNWDVSSVTKMNSMFNRATAFNQPLNNWDVSNVTNMCCMFYNAVTFNQPLDSWNVSNVTEMN